MSSFRNIRRAARATCAAVVGIVSLTVLAAQHQRPVAVESQGHADVGATRAAASHPIAAAPSRDRDEFILQGHGFVRDSGGFTTIDAPRATLFTVVLGIDEGGAAVGAYVDSGGKTRGFLQTERGEFIPIDFPGAAATLVSKVNARGQMVGAWPWLLIPSARVSLAPGTSIRVKTPLWNRKP